MELVPTAKGVVGKEGTQGQRHKGAEAAATPNTVFRAASDHACPLPTQLVRQSISSPVQSCLGRTGSGSHGPPHMRCLNRQTPATCLLRALPGPGSLCPIH